MGAWLDILADGETRRHALRPGLTRVGGRDADVRLPSTASGELHVWDDPPKVVRVAGEELFGLEPVRKGPSVELPLTSGARFRWGTLELRYGSDAPAPVLVEVPLEEAERVAPQDPNDRRAWRRVRAGLLVDLGLADRAVVRRWQDAVREGRFEPDACSRELLLETGVDPTDARLVDRCGSLLRDLLMAPLVRGARGAGRRARGAAKNGLAFLIAQIVAILVYSLLVAVFLVLVRAKWDVSLDGWIDALLGAG